MTACLLAIDMSLGKTGAVATFLQEQLEDEPGTKTLVIAPLLVATDTWPSEFWKWYHLRDIKYSVMCGTQEERRRALDKDEIGRAHV